MFLYSGNSNSGAVTTVARNLDRLVLAELNIFNIGQRYPRAIAPAEPRRDNFSIRAVGQLVLNLFPKFCFNHTPRRFPRPVTRNFREPGKAVRDFVPFLRHFPRQLDPQRRKPTPEIASTWTFMEGSSTDAGSHPQMEEVAWASSPCLIGRMSYAHQQSSITRRVLREHTPTAFAAVQTNRESLDNPRNQRSRNSRFFPVRGIQSCHRDPESKQR